MDENKIMGYLYKQTEKYITKIHATDVFVEIGTARGSGYSTDYYARLAEQHNVGFYTVDISDRSNILQHISNVVGVCASGSVWAQEVFPTMKKTIACLYLDNYDYNYWIGDHCRMIEDQKKEYSEKYNIVLNNQDCVVEHLKQIIALLPYMSDESLVVCDDTYLSNDCWIGKCGAVVPYLIANGFKIVEIENIEGSSFGVILKKANRD